MKAVYPRCGSTDPEHRVLGCRPCKRIYNARHVVGADAVRRELPPCFSCGIIRGNTLKVPVFTYSLFRTVYTDGKKRSLHFAALTICDECIVRHAVPSPSYMRANGLTERRWPSKRAA